MITVEPLGGLGNRLRVIDSAVALATEFETFVSIKWRQNKALSCRYFDLFRRFEPVGKVVTVEDNPLIRHLWIDPFNKIKGGVLGRSSPHFSKRELWNETGIERLRSLLALGRSVKVTTSSRFAQTMGWIREPRRWAANLVVLQTDDFCKSFSQNTVGVHIRRGDNTWSRERSPTKVFIAAMREQIERDPSIVFFLATDDPEEERIIRAEFGSVVVSRPKRSYDRTDSAAIQDAMIDLLSLSRCSRIMGSYWSSFAEMAAEIGNVRLDVLQENAEENRSPD